MLEVFIKSDIMEERAYKLSKKTKEADIDLKINIDGTGKSKIETTVGFLDHMLTIFSEFSLFDIELSAKGDTHIDNHHLVEEIGLCMGEAIMSSCGKDIRRFGSEKVPLDEALCEFVVDISGRPYFFLHGAELIKEPFYLNILYIFFDGLARGGKFTTHCSVYYGMNSHHIVEASFKASALAFHQATRKRGVERIPSTKGYI